METPPDCCPADLDLERYLLLEGPSDSLRVVRAHLERCPRCKSLLAEKQSAAERFQASSRAGSARERFVRAERRNARKLMLAAGLVPLLAAAVGGSFVLQPQPQQVPQPQQAPRPPPAPDRALVETVEAIRPSSLRTVSLRGREVELGQGTLEGAPASGPARPFVLQHTEVDIAVSAFVQRATVTQVFHNPFTEPVEAVYVFPLPDDAAVDEMELEVGGRVIRGEVHRREEARRRYEEAKSQGRRAALLDQERPNLFTQSVANVLPGETVKVRISYAARLRYDDGAFELNFPLTVGPRYVPGAPLAGESQGTGTSPDTDRVLDGSRVTPPVTRTGRDVAVRVRLEAGLPIERMWSVSHRLWAARPAATSAVVELDPSDSIPNRDLILRWRVSGQAPRAAAVAAGEAGSGAFALMLVPPARESQPAPVPREMVFVLDTSGSMRGAPLQAAKRAVELALDQMSPDDTFMLIDFGDAASSFHGSPLPNVPAYVERAKAHLRALPASGGTNQLAGIRAALGRPAEPGRLRTVLFLTDGFIGNEVEVIGECERLLGDARLFALGVGTSVNHYLLSRLSESGRGFYQYVRPDEDPNEVVGRFVRRLERPMVTDLSLDFGGLEVVQVLPERLPDLFDAQPLVVVGRYTRPGRGTVTLRGRRGLEPVEMKVEMELPERDADHASLASIWARTRIDALERLLHRGDRAEVIRDITTLGLEYKLVTAYTSFVAVDFTPVVARGTPGLTSVEAVEAPDMTTGADSPRSAAGPGYRSHRRKTPVQVDGKSGFILSPLLSPGLGGGGKGGGVLGGVVGGEKRLDTGGTAKLGVGDGRHSVVMKERRATPAPVAQFSMVDEGRATSSPVVSGSLASETIQKVLKAHQAQIRQVYERQLQKNPSLAGKVVVTFVIGKNGQVESARVRSSTMRDSAFEAALLAVIRKMKFPSPAGGASVTVTYPFLFAPGR